MRSRLLIVFLLLIALIISVLFLKKPLPERLSLFPVQNYDQKISDWISPSSTDYDKPLLTPEQQTLLKDELVSHYFSSDPTALSPWNPGYINQIIAKKAPDDLATVEQEQIIKYTNDKNKPDDEIGYAANFRPYTDQWTDHLTKNINLPQFQGQLHYDSTHRGIAIDNLSARILPTDEVHFYSHKLAGQGYPFDNLQASSLWAGTPVYILGETLDHAWYMVLTPDYYIAWVKSTGIARVDDHFVAEWQQKAKINLVAITQTEVPVMDTTDNIYRFSGYVGMIFPLENKDETGMQILIPVMDAKHQAEIRHAHLSSQDAALLPLSATIHHFAERMGPLLGRPYGWGNIYFYNDCSAELKSLYTIFGIWLPRHSSEQVNPDRVYGRSVNLSKEDMAKRIDYLTKNNHQFMTIVYIGGHVFMYLGHYPNPTDSVHALVPLTYQNSWGFRPKNPTPETDRRVVIGESVLLPLLKSYPEDASLASPAEKKHFDIMYLDDTQQDMVKFRALEFSKIDLRILLSP